MRPHSLTYTDCFSSLSARPGRRKAESIFEEKVQALLADENVRIERDDVLVDVLSMDESSSAETSGRVSLCVDVPDLAEQDESASGHATDHAYGHAYGHMDVDVDGGVPSDSSTARATQYTGTRMGTVDSSDRSAVAGCAHAAAAVVATGAASSTSAAGASGRTPVAAAKKAVVVAGDTSAASVALPAARGCETDVREAVIYEEAGRSPSSWA